MNTVLSSPANNLYTGCPANLRTFKSIEDGSRIAPGTKITTPTPVFPKLESPSVSAAAPAVPVAAPISAVASEGAAGAVVHSEASNMPTEEMSELIASKGAQIRDLKASKADKAVIKIAVDELLALKQRYFLTHQKHRILDILESFSTPSDCLYTNYCP